MDRAGSGRGGRWGLKQGVWRSFLARQRKNVPTYFHRPQSLHLLRLCVRQLLRHVWLQHCTYALVLLCRVASIAEVVLRAVPHKDLACCTGRHCNLATCAPCNALGRIIMQSEVAAGAEVLALGVEHLQPIGTVHHDQVAVCVRGDV